MSARVFDHSFADSGQGPLYVQLSDRIAEDIDSGALKPGGGLPPEREIADRTGLSRVTVRKAVQALVADGRLVQRRGSGTFVARPVERVEQALSLLTSFSEDMARRGKEVRSLWLRRAVGAPSPEEMLALGLGAEDNVSRLERARIADGVPLAIERAALPTSILPNPDFVSDSLYDFLDTLGRRPTRALQRISAANLGDRDAAQLDVTAGDAALRIERLSYLPDGRVVEFTRSLYRGDAYDFAAELRMTPNDSGETP